MSALFTTNFVFKNTVVLAADCGSPTACEQAALSCREGGGTWDGTNGTCQRSFDESNPIISKVLKPVIQLLSAAVGLVVVISLIVAGIQYSSARDNPQMVAAAKNRILMSLLALVMFIFGFAVLQWLVPSGVL